jgi:glycosyltransferase involved in cell wall biosynthesis
MKVIKILLPCYNEEKNIINTYNSIKEVIKDLDQNYTFKILFVDDGSYDKTWEIIQSIEKKDSIVSGLRLSRNFGKELAITAGFHHYNDSDAIILMDSDLQHPPKYIPKFINEWESGIDMVIGIREDSSELSIWKKISSKIFHWIMRTISEFEYIPRNTDFRIIDKKIIKEFLKLKEHNRISRSLLDWLGFKKSFISFQADPRIHGTPSYSSMMLFRLALSSFMSHSLFPLRITGFLGVAITIIFGCLGFFIFCNQILYKTPFSDFIFSGTGMLGVLMLFCIGMILMALGLIALYIGNIHREVLERHLFVVSEKVGEIKG